MSSDNTKSSTTDEEPFRLTTIESGMLLDHACRVMNSYAAEYPNAVVKPTKRGWEIWSAPSE